MPTINPLLYSDTSEDEIASTAGAKVVQPPELGAFAGFGSAVVTTAKNTASAVWASGKEAVERAVVGDAYDKLTEAAPSLNMPKMEKIDPLTTGVASQILAPLAVDIPLSIFSLGAGAAGAAARERLTQYGDLVESGVAPDVARAVANQKGAETAATFAITRIPFAKAIGQISSRAMRIGARAAVGAGVQTGLDFIGGESRGAILEANGFALQAQQMRQWDMMRFGADVIGGSLLGVTTNMHVDEPTQLAARWWQQADQLQHESGPGIPATPTAIGATTDATIKAVNDINAGQPVNVVETPGIFDADFLAQNAADLKAARGYVKEHEGIIADYDKQLTDMQATIEKARNEGFEDIAQHLEEQELPRLQAIKQSSERIADQWRDDIARLENPEAPHPAAELARSTLTDHAEDLAAIRAKAEEFVTPPDSTTPAAMADKGTAAPRDVVTEAKELLTNYRNPVQEAAATGEAAAAAPAPKLTREQQELVNMHQELRELADRTGDADLHAELTEAMNAHQAEHMEAGKFNVAALCAIG